jgi:dihydrofolate reductase
LQYLLPLPLAGLAAQALAAGLVSECQFYFVPFVVGGGNRLPPDGLFITLELLEQRRFVNGAVY